MGATGLEPVTPSVSSKGIPDVSESSKGLAKSSPYACTAACTNSTDSPQADPVEALASALLALSPADKARLAALLLGQPAVPMDVPAMASGCPASKPEGIEVGHHRPEQ
jgi:hypothetical protein